MTTKATDDNPRWTDEYPNDALSRAMAAAAGKKLPSAETNKLDSSDRSSIVGFSKARRRSVSVEDNTNTHTTKEATMPTVKTQPKAKATGTSRRKASPVASSYEATMVPDEKRPDTQPGNDQKGSLRFSDTTEKDALVPMVYMPKSALIAKFGKLPTGGKITFEPTFD